MKIQNPPHQNFRFGTGQAKSKTKKRPDIRFLYDLKKVIYDRQRLKKARNFPLYYMYRGVESNDGLRYDITVIPGKMLGKEFVKTKGNCNSKNFQELYHVLKGKAIFLMQKMKGRIVKDVFAAKAKKGEWVIVPPRYYVVSINPSKNVLKLGNWVTKKNKNVYEGMEMMGGAAYYFTKSGWVKNKNYKKVPRLKFKKPLKKMPKNLNFLKG